jgi:FKBP-type peptidyl-prolyl cis-trans isomerase FkpA
VLPIAADTVLLLARTRRTIIDVVVLVFLVMGGIGTAGCSDSPTAPANNAPYSQTDLVAGTGTDAQAGRTLSVHYTGWLFNEDAPSQRGAQFDSSLRGEPFAFTLGVGEVIAGWDQGLTGMRVGGIRRLIIPPSLGYGVARSGPIPPNATLLFEVELLDVQ